MKCAEICKKRADSCTNSGCRLWMDYPGDLNCVLISVEFNGSLSLKQVGERLNLSHVRIKQIQDGAIKKINKKMKKEGIY